uniref:Histone-lysine N-methyltransferase, H3 lysine-79 specific n=1 Tax=Peronospora matthiolae TaxID=2874970 RepID=A0AAV1UEB4_9STRA
MTLKRRPANRKGPRSAEHRKIRSPCLLDPKSTCTDTVLPSTFELPTIPNRSPTDVERSNALEQKRTETKGEVADSLSSASAVSDASINAVASHLKIPANSSDPSFGLTTSSLLNGEPTFLSPQKLCELQEKQVSSMVPFGEDQDEKKVNTREPARRGRRKRRPVDVLHPSEKPFSHKSSYMQRNVKSKVQALRRARPAPSRVEAAVEKKEKTRKQIAAKKTDRSTASTSKWTTTGDLSPVQDEKKKTPEKKRSSKARRSLESAYTFESQTEYVSTLIKALYEEQEQDDREMYSITRDTVVTETSSCKRSQEIEDLDMEEFRRLMTYGEVSIESVATTILPLLNLDEDDVFFDLGCGTGKILVQAALQTPCRRATGIELMQNRVLEGQRALKRLESRDVAILRGKQVEIFRGDIFVPPEEARLMDATVVFINNVMFGPALMLKVMELLKDMTKLRCVITLRKICERHGDSKCTRAGNFCIEYVHPPIEAEIDVSWADKTSVYLYESLDYKLCELRRQLSNGAH